MTYMNNVSIVYIVRLHFKHDDITTFWDWQHDSLEFLATGSFPLDSTTGIACWSRIGLCRGIGKRNVRSQRLVDGRNELTEFAKLSFAHVLELYTYKWMVVSSYKSNAKSSNPYTRHTLRASSLASQALDPMFWTNLLSKNDSKLVSLTVGSAMSSSVVR